MGKKARRTLTAPPPKASQDGAEIPVVGGREPCPCGSGRRYKACHGRAAANAVEAMVARPFEGLPGECDWIALREVVPAATATLKLAGEHADRDVTLATVLPMAWPGLARSDGAVLVGLQTQSNSGDISRDVADALLRAFDSEPGTPVPPVGLPEPGPRLQDLLDLSAPFEVVVHEGFDFWLDENASAQVRDNPEVNASLERANAAVVPTARLAGVEAAYWCRTGDRTHLRWVMPYEERLLLDAMARLHAAGQTALGPGSRYVGSFRAHGLLVPVWDLAPGTEVDDVEEPTAEFGRRLEESLASDSPLTPEERRARNGLLGRQLTLR